MSVNVRTPARGLAAPGTDASTSGQAGAPASNTGRDGEFLGEAFGNFGNLIKSKVAEAFSGVSSMALQKQQHPFPPGSSEQGPRSLDELMANRVSAAAQRSDPSAPDSELPDRQDSFDSEANSQNSMNSQASNASSVALMDGTEAMVRCMRKGDEALECPVCLQLFQNPVTPVGSQCKCTFCEVCFGNLVRNTTHCSKCNQQLPFDPTHFVVNKEIRDAIRAFQEEGGEDAELATMMSGLKGRRDKPKYRLLEMKEFELDPQPLATGAYGKVFKGVWTTHNIAVAVKNIHTSSEKMSQKQTMETFRKEVDILAMLDHPHVLKLFGAVIEPSNVCIVTELVPGGSLFDLIHTKPLLKAEAVVVIGEGVCKGMQYLHSMGIIHRDLKPGNLLMGAVQTPSGPQLVVKVADFGLARVQDTARTMTGGIGTSQYTAPEVLRSERYDTKVDVFSFGIILWEIHAKRLPYGNMTQMQIAVAVATQDHRPPPPPHCPSGFWELMQQCWHKEATSRPSFVEVLAHLEDMQFVFSLAGSAQNRMQGNVKAMTPNQGSEFSKTLGGGGNGSTAAAATNGGGGETQPPGSDMDVQEQSKKERQVLRVPDSYASISEALAHARNDDQIRISAGHYKESLALRDKVLELVGEGQMQAILIQGVGEQPALAQQHGFLRVSNLMIKAAGKAAVEVAGGSMVLEDCYVSGADSGVAVTGGGEVAMRRSVLSRCRKHGVHISGGGRATLESCSMFENGSHGVVALHQSSSLHLTRCMVSNNQGAAVGVDLGGEGVVEDNDLRNNKQGACLVGASSTDLVRIGSNLTS